MASNPSTDELLTEHFRYTPLSLIDDIINAVNTIIYRAIEAIETGLLDLPPAQLGFTKTTLPPANPGAKSKKKVEDLIKDYMQEEIENGCHQLETLLVDSADKTFDQFEIYILRNLLTVEEGLSPWMRLGHYEHLQIPPRPNAPTPESILLLRRKLQATRTLNSALRRQQAQDAALISQLQTLLSSPTASTDPPQSNLSFLTFNPSATPLGLSFNQEAIDAIPLTTRAGFATSQLPALRAQLELLRPKLQSLKGAVDGVDWEGKREDRRAYIEGRVRRVVGRTGGNLEGESAGPMGREEVEGIEEVVSGGLR